VSRHRFILAVVVLVSAAACGGDGPPPSADAGAGPYDALYGGLCQARAQATQPGVARETFFDRVHQPLHELAADAAGGDRAAAARLLEAKEALERDFAADPGVVPADLDRLLEVTRQAIAGAGRPAPEPCQEAP
jgi:hypothetical protein